MGKNKPKGGAVKGLRSQERRPRASSQPCRGASRYAGARVSDPLTWRLCFSSGAVLLTPLWVQASLTARRPSASPPGACSSLGSGLIRPPGGWGDGAGGRRAASCCSFSRGWSAFSKDEGAGLNRSVFPGTVTIQAPYLLPETLGTRWNLGADFRKIYISAYRTYRAT